MLLGRVLGHDVAGKGGGRGQSPPPPPTLSRPRRPKEEDRGAVQPLASSLLTPSRVTGTAGTTTKTGLCVGQKESGTGADLGSIVGSHVGGGWASTARSRGCDSGGGAGQQDWGGELDPDLLTNLHQQPHQLSPFTCSVQFINNDFSQLA